LTTDHSLTQALMDAGTISAEEAANHRYRNVLYRYLGTKEGSAGAEIQEFEPQSGDRFVLCSDGVTDGVDDDQLEGLLAKQVDPQSVAESIIRAAQEGGSKDNITCVVLHVD
jgi:serine/threonine protein phosphatase PrpC